MRLGGKTDRSRHTAVVVFIGIVTLLTALHAFSTNERLKPAAGSLKKQKESSAARAAKLLEKEQLKNEKEALRLEREADLKREKEEELPGEEDEKADAEEEPMEPVSRLQKQPQEQRSAGLVGAAGVGNYTEPAVREVLLKLQKCRDFDCIKAAHIDLAGRTRFNFPHFFLVGWQKAATTSINGHLRRHPQYLPGMLKEPHWFTVCKNYMKNPYCQPNSLRDYLRRFLRIDYATAGGLEHATSDSSVDYAWKGEPLAQELHDLFPWLKIVMIMREPTSRMISYTRMWTMRRQDKDKPFRDPTKACGRRDSSFGCLYDKFVEEEKSHYDTALEGWLKVFPPEQIHVMQFEQLQEDPALVLRGLKEFLGMDPHLPVLEEFRNVNSRRGSGGYPMTRTQYDKLLAVVRPRAERVAKMLGEKGLANETVWLGRWSRVWERVLAEDCNADGQCEVNSNK